MKSEEILLRHKENLEERLNKYLNDKNKDDFTNIINDIEKEIDFLQWVLS